MAHFAPLGGRGTPKSLRVIEAPAGLQVTEHHGASFRSWSSSSTERGGLCYGCESILDEMLLSLIGTVAG